MPAIRFFIPGRPVPQPRPRFDSRHNRMYTPGKVTKYKEMARSEAYKTFFFIFPVLEDSKKGDFTGPISLHLVFRFKPPKKMPKGRTQPTVKPDIDNLAKTIMDALNGVAYKDDSQVVVLTVNKRYTDEIHPEEGVAVGIEYQ